MSYPYLTEPYFPKKVGESLALIGNKVHPSFCYGRNNSTKPIDGFTLSFFSTRNNSQLEELWRKAEEINMGEVHVKFFCKREDGSVTELSPSEIKNFNPKNAKYSLTSGGITCDELRDVPVSVLHIIFIKI